MAARAHAVDADVDAALEGDGERDPDAGCAERVGDGQEDELVVPAPEVLLTSPETEIEVSQ